MKMKTASKIFIFSFQKRNEIPPGESSSEDILQDESDHSSSPGGDLQGWSSNGRPQTGLDQMSNDNF